ncbi:MAG: DUF4494 domain-containing protein [Paludibacteraceae bacterium]|nr:DUF4494 domain-containing protein [Paludibacteraceae bacterium]
MEFYECKVKYQREVGDGKLQKMNDTYLIEAVSFGDAETRVLEEVRPFVFAGQEVEMKSIKKVLYTEVLPNDEGHYWFKAKVMLTTIDENAGKEKKIATGILVQEVDMESAYKAVNKLMKDSITDYEITNLQVTNIVDVLSLVKNDSNL